MNLLQEVVARPGAFARRSGPCTFFPGGEIFLRPLDVVTGLWLDNDMSDRNNKNPMTGDGMWNKAGRKHYRHESGAEITYDGNAWCWRIVGQARGYATLGIAKYEVERMVTA